ncbi:hypothetical protein KJI95_02585 [Shewanella sp. JM162201]|uniref:Uncharacterized protein n=1 Tax=Shewanella jiangmenensis TaxID=2837387 RepID=A0ABS5UZ50_9GAMM|nr:DUF4144 domain-containing protein [Shewanella jiangmenensis]MBT1443410.1 hypothetical protein [Shewanella jiangmenensis]
MEDSGKHNEVAAEADLAAVSEKTAGSWIQISWPAVLKLGGEDELTYLADEAALIAELDGLIVCDGDMLIDSGGCCFALDSAYGTGLNGTEFEALVLPKSLSLKSLLPKSLSLKSLPLKGLPTKLDAVAMSALIQAHEFSRAQTCLIKIQFATVAAAIAALAPRGA